MKLFPEKVEAKIFILILIICLSMSLLGARLMLVSQEALLVSERAATLSRIADHHAERISDSMAFESELAVRAAERIEAVLASSNIESEAVNNQSTLEERIQGAVLDSSRFIQRGAGWLSVVLDREDAPSNEQGRRQSHAQDDHERAGPLNNPWQAAVWTSPTWDPIRDAWNACVLVPLYDRQNYAGFVRAEHAIRGLFAGLDNLRAEESLGGAYFVDAEGEIVVPPGLRSGEAGIRASGELDTDRVREIAKRYTTRTPRGDRSLSILFDEPDARGTAYVVPLDGFEWKLLVVLNSDVIAAQITELTWKLTLSAGMGALILVFLMRASFRQLFTHRIVGLERSARAFTERGLVDFGDAGKDEIGSLSVAFREMVESLASREAELTVRNQQLKNEISGRLNAVESLRESELKFRTLFDKSSDAVLVIDGKKLIDCNEAAVHMLHCSSKEDLLKRTLLDLTPTFQPAGLTSSTFADNMLELATVNGNYRFEWVIRAANCVEFWVEAVITVVPYEGRSVFYMVWRDATIRKEKEQEHVRLTMAIEQAAEAIIVTDLTGVILYVNPSFELLTGCPRKEAIGTVSAVLATEKDGEGASSEIWAALEQGNVWKGRMSNTREDETLYQAETTVSPVRDAEGALTNYVIVSYDMTKEATLEAQLLQAQKMEAIGELASGIAHEINTPTQYIGDNIRFLQESFGDIRTLLQKFQGLLDLVKRDAPAESEAADIEVLATEIDLEYLADEIPVAIEQSLEGNTRIAEIVRAMKEFAHPGLEEKTAVDINHAIENTIAVARNEWKYVAEIVMEFDPELPEIPCLPGAFNQVILNIIVNGAHAIGETVKDGNGEKGTITIRTAVADEWVEVRIQDTGPGIPEKIRRKIFDPFFTTKDPGKGTGQGLALVHAVIVEKHGGTVEVDTELGVGTTFVIRLPLIQETTENGLAQPQELVAAEVGE